MIFCFRSHNKIACYIIIRNQQRFNADEVSIFCSGCFIAGLHMGLINRKYQKFDVCEEMYFSLDYIHDMFPRNIKQFYQFLL